MDIWAGWVGNTLPTGSGIFFTQVITIDNHHKESRLGSHTYYDRLSDYFCVGIWSGYNNWCGLFSDEPHCCFDSKYAGMHSQLGSKHLIITTELKEIFTYREVVGQDRTLEVFLIRT